VWGTVRHRALAVEISGFVSSQGILPAVKLSIIIITCNEEANLPRTLESVSSLVRDGKGEIVVIDSGSTDRTIEIAQSHAAKVFVETWKGYAGQKNAAIEKAAGEWILSLDADEEVEPALAEEIDGVIQANSCSGFWMPRKNFFLGRWIRHGGYWPDRKLRLFRRGTAAFEDRLVHEDAKLTSGVAGRLKHALIHHSYPTLSDYIDHMNRYSSLGAETARAKGHRGFNVIDIVVRPFLTLVYNYFFRLGFLDGREGLLLHLYHTVYVSWKYAKAWELGRVKADQLRSR
jgi:glycosyltransferase involved in cell wall biosynthesis